MRKLLAVGSLLGVSLPLTAAAQPPPPPPPAPGGPTGYEPAEPKMRLDVGLIVGLPQGDFGDAAETSPGINIDFGYTVAPNISIFAGIRYFSIQVEGGTGGAELGNYDFHVGGRYSMPVSPTAKVFGEGYLQYATLSISDDGFEASESGIGFGARGGAVFNVSGNIGIGGALSFSTATIEEFDAAWLGLEGFVSFGF